MDYVIGIDVGTTNIRVAAYTVTGVQVTYTSERFQIIHPNPGWTEISSVHIWGCICICMRRVLDEIGTNNIKAVGVSSMGEAGVPLDSGGKALYPVIDCFDSRVGKQVAELEGKISKRDIFSITGQTSSSKYGIYKLMWIKENYPEIYEKTAHWLSIEDYVIYRLTGEIATDYSIASRTMAFDVNKLEWSDQILSESGISSDIMSKVYPGGTVVGEVHAGASRETGLKKGVKVVTGGHNHSCAAIAVNIFEDGVILDSMGTAEATIVATSNLILNDYTFENWICMYPHCGGKLYRALSSNQSCGASIEWYLATIGRDIQILSMQASANKYDLLFEDAQIASSNVPGLYYLPFIRGSIENMNMKGAFIGIQDTHKSGDFINAILEGLSYEIKLQISRFEKTFSEPFTKLRAVGGSSKSDYWINIKSQILDRPIEIPVNKEAAVYGAAILATIGIGEVRMSEISQYYLPKNVLYPKKMDDRYQKRYDEYMKIREALNNLYK